MSAAVQLQERSEASLDIRPLQPTIGAEIAGVDLRQPLSDAVRDEIRAAVLKHKVVFFRDQDLIREQHEAFAKQFGPLYTHPSTTSVAQVPAIHQIVPHEVKPVIADPKAAFRDGYHTDTSWRLVPAWGAVLRAVNLPPVGGDTIWVDAGLAYRELSDELKQRLDGLHVTHDFRSSLNRAGHDYPIVAHPIVRTHRETGEKILWVNFSQSPSIVGLDRAEGHELLTRVLDQYRRPEFQVRFSWRPGSIAFWDNRAAVHYAVRNYGDFPRLMERVLIADERLHADL
ncbi:TauD/TfdA dioxygenase family protein [Inquilinus limosus]|uniref:Taurine catabolism dioxygenase TauD n=1 Tax=Inquilinus limosus TaxID=171674 RepID=A0A211ZV81_9PROT|nr:TauD/TfdA family dioxygenase [Inquilinus limosus]OWJ69180.1 taurine catabolism dioxygenase TauD [Inquilinus limosus]